MKADPIVMTSHGSTMRTYFLGPHVVRYAKSSVLVVRHQRRLVVGEAFSAASRSQDRARPSPPPRYCCD